jgi:hypothetical protein
MFLYVFSDDCYGINLYLRGNHTSVLIELFLYINKDMLRRILICKIESFAINAYKYIYIYISIHISIYMTKCPLDGHTYESIEIFLHVKVIGGRLGGNMGMS